MNVQPYFPEPVTVSGNVAAEPYDDRLRFLRWVTAIHLATVVPVVVIASLGLKEAGAALAPVEGSVAPAWLPPIAILLLLSVSRKVHEATGLAWLDRAAVAVLLPAFLYLLGSAAIRVDQAGVAVWPLAVAAGFQAVYAFVCGRDFSFVGQFVLAALATIAISFGVGWFLDQPTLPLSWGAALAVVWLFYHVYDLASLLQRRRLDEKILAVADLYRDVLNVFSYSFRVVQHWRRFRI